MKVFIDFSKREIHFHEDTSLEEMTFCMLNYFPEETWGDFKFVIDAGVNENTDSEGEYYLPF